MSVLAIKKDNALQILETYDQNPFGKLTGSKTKWVFTNVRIANLIVPYQLQQGTYYNFVSVQSEF